MYHGCDSIATLHLVINPVVTGEETITICEAALPYSWNNQSITAAGDYTATLISVRLRFYCYTAFDYQPCCNR